jgi:pimeloyl-ACP methyl ester carboxylesterase
MVWAAVLLCGGAAWAETQQQPEAAPRVVRSAKGLIELGTLDGAQYRIQIPADWNHELVVYFHGYSEREAHLSMSSGQNQVTGPVLERGFAVAQSAYSQPGWALAQGVPESEALRQYFVKTYGKPVATYAIGESMGGAMVMQTIEENPRPYAGVLDLCGSVGPTYEAFQRRFAWRAAFDFYFPGIMPALVPVPAEYHETPELRMKIAAALKANPAGAAAMRNLTGLHTNADLVRDVSYFTFVIKDMQHRSGGNPFSNRNTIYVGTTPGSTAGDNALNDGVKRYSAEEAATRYLVAHYTPTGRVTKPMLALHTTYDPIIPGWTLARYADIIAEAGYSENFVQQYVHRDGHCAISPQQIGATFDELREWVREGKRPEPGLLRP